MVKQICNITSKKVTELYNLFKTNNITVYIDGGWGVDALMGRQTREHSDLDIAVHSKDNDKLRMLLIKNGYNEIQRTDSSEFMYAMTKEGVVVDIHVFEYDENGRNIYGIDYPFGSLTGKGVIDGQEVLCIAPSFQFRFKTGYEPKQKVIHDVRALSEKFGFELSSKYAVIKPSNIDEYIASQSLDKRVILQKVREVISAAAPNAMEKISYQMPTFWQGKNLVHFAVSKNHLGIYPGGEASGVFAEKLKASGIDFDKGTIRFVWGKPINYDLIADIVRWRVEQLKIKK